MLISLIAQERTYVAKQKTNKSGFFFLSTCVLLTFLSFPTTAASPSELQGVKNEISRQQKALSNQEKQLDELQKSLRSQETSIAQLEKEIKQTKQALATAKANVGQLQRKMDELEGQKKAQTERLETLIQTYYVTQRANASASLLQQGVEEDRISQYFQHLAKARAETINELESTKKQLEQSQQQLLNEQSQIESLLKQQSTKHEQLAKTQGQRKKTLGNIKQSISSDKNYLAELQRNETRLKAEIAKAAKRNAIPMDGLAKQTGKLPWPLKGSILHQFGTKQTGQINWKGIVIAARYGEQVKSVYPGTVVFAEYLRGYGLVVLIDHGKGDMTLYGYNQALLKKEGDKVTAGEVIALAGDTGGQDRASLYFEIRRNSEAQNPRNWLVR
ncbi:TPA: peptidoglycan DD-metalloendopeptidase family protein [Vibrio vulnificus]|uniref:murein hydrolase activator EnvC family protein n=1 Tax=Vibrio vulnificus TaxID=672 RepID=UPI00103396E4|nr:peptidoglycan DD-metalloendopeptidase family protein [Vibrio vulnificus]EIO3979423.1 peptidoglycan DD-metalloendopeptidase family protein [Vibrio vulnificus]MCA4023562.1 peptidoglycan DD-metalloendopeptidase family protein [Vibrio vulnificus]WHE22992.1 peptidoglycan DD-metalloendopeptidase family protein [Vibrio vulnificus]HAS6110768.1 peptidoglycan DD-metalloendopeptidase family protein [Vibrio vulnificus]HAS6167284.1 peptidoglycan DD-metalloendopeptidase family protein [Vibrio vulnificus]